MVPAGQGKPGKSGKNSNFKKVREKFSQFL